MATLHSPKGINDIRMPIWHDARRQGRTLCNASLAFFSLQSVEFGLAHSALFGPHRQPAVERTSLCCMLSMHGSRVRTGRICLANYLKLQNWKGYHGQVLYEKSLFSSMCNNDRCSQAFLSRSNSLKVAFGQGAFGQVLYKTPLFQADARPLISSIPKPQ